MNESVVGELFMTPNFRLNIFFFFLNNQILENHYSLLHHILVHEICSTYKRN